MIRRRVPTLLAALLAILVTAGCVSVPDHGSVRAGPTPVPATQGAAPFDFTPSGPEPGDTPVEVVSGFLLAMQATPVRTAVAREFLTDEAGTEWAPEKGTVVYGSYSLPTKDSRVVLEMNDTVELDGRGEWLGDTSRGTGISYPLRLVEEKGQWRISNPPQALLIPQSHFESRFQQYFLYFFDKSAQILVPEPVYLPRGDQTATLLVRGLLEGPDQEMLGVTRTFIPAGTEYDLSVPVSANGVAEVPLSDEVLDLAEEPLDMALAQLAWTLRQVPGIDGMQITVDGSPLDIPGEGAAREVRAWPEYDPAVNWASEELFGLRDGRVVAIVGDDERRIAGLFGSEDYGLRSIAVDLAGENVAGVTEDGSTVLGAPRRREGGEVPSDEDLAVLYSGGTDVLRPAWDIHGQTWLVDRTAAGARVVVVRDGTATAVEAPGISGADVRAMLVSRGGTRLVAVVGTRRGDRLVVARVLRNEEGVVRGISAAERVSVGAVPVTDIQDIAWRTPIAVAMLTGPSEDRSQIRVVRIDGSSALDEVTTDAEILRDAAQRVVSAPSTASALYVGTREGQLYELAANGRWVASGVRPGLQSPAYVG